MKKLLLISILITTLGFTAFSSPKHVHIMAVHGWLFDIFTGDPVSHHWVYFNSHNDNALPHVDSARTNNLGHYHIDSILCLNNAPLDIEIYTLDCHQNRHSYHIFYYYPYYTFNFNICVGPLSYCKSDWNWAANPSNSLQVQFNDHSQGNINKWSWNFGDGTTSNQPNPLHTFTTAGTYPVSLEVMDTNSVPPCIDADTQNVTVIYVNHYNLAGQVFAGSFPHPNGIATLHYLTPDGFVFLDSCNLNVNGVYVFYQVPEGNYLVQVSRVTTGNPAMKYWPTYFGNTINWQNSQLLNLQSDYFQGDINLQPLLPVSYGPGKIGGTAYRDDLGNLVPAANVEIMLADDDMNYLTYLYSNDNGEYEFTDIPYGTYHLHAEIPGLSLPSVTVTIDANQPEINNVSIMTSGPVNGLEEYNSTFDAGPVFPNPNNGKARIEISMMKPGKIELTVTDILGKQETFETLILDAGINTVDLPLEKLHSGTYIINITVPDKNIIRKKFELIR